MGKAHAVAYSAVGAVFNAGLRPRLEMVTGSNPESSERYRSAFGFARAADNWRALVADARVEAVVIAAPQATPRQISEAAFALGKPVFCEKPLGASLADAQAMVAAAESADLPNMIGFNYVRTPATQFVRKLLAEGLIGELTWFRGVEFPDDPRNPPWRRVLKECTEAGYTGIELCLVGFMRRHVDRISYMHFKDISPTVKADVIARNTGFYEACGQGIFCNLGQGDVDFPAVRQLLLDHGFEGWCTVEQDCDPTLDVSPVDDACANREYLQSIGF